MLRTFPDGALERLCDLEAPQFRPISETNRRTLGEFLRAQASAVLAYDLFTVVRSFLGSTCSSLSNVALQGPGGVMAISTRWSLTQQARQLA